MLDIGSTLQTTDRNISSKMRTIWNHICPWWNTCIDKWMVDSGFLHSPLQNESLQYLEQDENSFRRRYSKYKCPTESLWLYAQMIRISKARAFIACSSLLWMKTASAASWWWTSHFASSVALFALSTLVGPSHMWVQINADRTSSPELPHLSLFFSIYLFNQWSNPVHRPSSEFICWNCRNVLRSRKHEALLCKWSNGWSGVAEAHSGFWIMNFYDRSHSSWFIDCVDNSNLGWMWGIKTRTHTSFRRRLCWRVYMWVWVSHWKCSR